MENFLKSFLGKGVFFSLENIINKDDSPELNYTKCLQKIIFKQDVITELKRVLSSAFDSESFTVKNDLVKKFIARLHLLLLSEEYDNAGKTDVFRYVFKTFALICKDDNVHIMQFFVVLSHILGMNAVPNISENSEIDACNRVINRQFFNSAFEVETSNPTSATFSIFKELLVCLSQFSLNFNLTEIQPYKKWLQQLLKNLAYFHPFQNVFLEIFSLAAETDLRLLEGNSDHIFCNVLALRPPRDEEFCQLYGSFLEKALGISSKFQRTVKFIEKFLSCIKVTSTLLTRETVLPLNVISAFSKIVAVASNQQSLLLLDTLLQSLDECFINISQQGSGSDCSLLLFVTSDLLISFLKEVKLYAPSISKSTLLVFIEKLNAFKESLIKFGTYLFDNTPFMLKNDDVVNTFLSLCIYSGEVEMLINCYRDSVLSDAEAPPPPGECDFHSCLTSEQWKNLVNFMLKSKMDALGPTCFQLALQKCRHRILRNDAAPIDETTPKMIIAHLTSAPEKHNLFRQLQPDDLIIAMGVLTPKQSRSVCKKIFKRLLENETGNEPAGWLCSSALRENSFFVLSMFSQVLKETGRLLRDVVPDEWHSKLSWLSDESLDCSEGLPEKMNSLLLGGKKIRKHLRQNPQQREALARIFEIFAELPLPHVRDNCRRLGLCFALLVGVCLSEDENRVRLPLQSLCGFLTSDVDASTCFDIGLCVSWLGRVSFEGNRTNDVRMRAIEILIRNSPNTKFGLSQLGQMIDSAKRTRELKTVESRVVVYNELGKCWQRAKKRKADNDLIGSYRSKLAKMICEEAKQLQEGAITPENSKILLKILAIELSNAIRTNDENEISALMAEKFPSHFDFAVITLKRNSDEPSVSFLTVVLQFMPRIRKFLPEGSLMRIWKAVKSHGKTNWRLFCDHGSDEEFAEILADLVKMSKKFLKPETEKHSANCFDIWVSFFEMSSESKRHCCQLRVQEFFQYIHTCDSFLGRLSTGKKISLLRFGLFCVSRKEVILTSHMLDTVIQILVNCLEEDGSSVEEFCGLFAVETETASAMFLRQFDWSKSKVHLFFVVLRKMLAALIKRCDAGVAVGKDDAIRLSTAALGMEKWVSLLVKREKDFARTTPYFLTVLISSVASVTVLPAIKIHLVNCINYFLSISDSHTVAYLMRVLKPGYQQVFNSMYTQFKKYHKYSGKI